MGFFGAYGFHPRNIVIPPPVITGYNQIQDEGVNLTQQNILDFEGSGVTATNGVGKTIVTIPGNIPATNYGLFSQTSSSIPITATTTEGTLIDGGVGTLSVPANGFSIGDSFRAELGGYMSSKNNDSITIRVKTGSVILADSGPLSLPGINNQVWLLYINFTIRNIGANTIASIVTIGEFHILKLASGTQQGFGFNTINNTTFNTTISNTLDITVQWSSNSALNSIYSDLFVLNKIY